jgi:predicted dehydrogenase
VKVAVVGHGLIGRQRAAAIHALAGSEDIAIAATIDPLPRDGADYGGAPHLESIDELARDDFDAAVVALPHDLAVGVSLELLAAGKPLLYEKPLGMTAGQARALEQAAAELPLPSFVGFNYRFLPHVCDVFGAINDGTLGDIRSIDLLIGHGGHPGSGDGWKLLPERAGGGVLIDPGVHLLDLMLQMRPDLEPRIAAGTRGFWNTGIEEDLVLVFGAGATIATVRVSHVRWVNDLRFEIIGNDGYVIAKGRGGNYGPMTTRVGRRWGWHGDEQNRSQRETETRADHGTENVSLVDETSAVLRRWTGANDQPGWPRPATFEDGRRVTELVTELYTSMGDPAS